MHLARYYVGKDPASPNYLQASRSNDRLQRELRWRTQAVAICQRELESRGHVVLTQGGGRNRPTIVKLKFKRPPAPIATASAAIPSAATTPEAAPASPAAATAPVPVAHRPPARNPLAGLAPGVAVFARALPKPRPHVRLTRQDLALMDRERVRLAEVDDQRKAFYRFLEENEARGPAGHTFDYNPYVEAP